jgi:hypothetical protein
VNARMAVRIAAENGTDQRMVSQRVAKRQGIGALGGGGDRDRETRR